MCIRCVFVKSWEPGWDQDLKPAPLPLPFSSNERIKHGILLDNCLVLNRTYGIFGNDSHIIYRCYTILIFPEHVQYVITYPPISPFQYPPSLLSIPHLSSVSPISPQYPPSSPSPLPPHRALSYCTVYGCNQYIYICFCLITKRAHWTLFW